LAVNLRLAFEIFHDVKETIRDIWMINEAEFDLIKIAEGILATKEFISDG
jgi:hypothetical protein